MKDKNSRNRLKLRSEGGFGMIQLLIVVGVMGIIVTFGLIGVSRARSDTQFTNAARSLKSYIEKGVSDAKRRHALGAERAQIAVLNTTSYQVTEDFGEDGVVEQRTVQLPPGASFVYVGTPPSITIDMHGNVAEGQVQFALNNGNGRTSQITVSSIGDASMDENAPTMPTVSNTPTSVDVKNSVALLGNTAPNLDPSPSAAPSPLPQCTGHQTPANTACRCRTGQQLDASGKCK